MYGELIRKDHYYINMARAAATASKCRRAKFGAVIVSRDDRIVATSYNGKPRRSTCDRICFREGLPPNGHGPHCCLHAETNAIIFSAPLERAYGTMYVTGKPCDACSLLIQQAEIIRLVYLEVEDGSHPGWAGDNIFDKYGSTIDLCPYTDRRWEEEYGREENNGDHHECQDQPAVAGPWWHGKAPRPGFSWGSLAVGHLVHRCRSYLLDLAARRHGG